VGFLVEKEEEEDILFY